MGRPRRALFRRYGGVTDGMEQVTGTWVNSNTVPTSALSNYGANLFPYLIQFCRRHPTHRPPHTGFVRCDHPMRQGKAVMRQGTFGIEIRRLNCDSGGVPGGCAGNLTEDEVTARQPRQHQGRSDLGARQIRKRKRHHDDVAAYKSRHAASSSGVSQSAAHAVCAGGSRLSRPSPFPRALRKARNSASSRWTDAGAVLISSMRPCVSVLILETLAGVSEFPRREISSHDPARNTARAAGEPA